jgi:hypothetical protein
VNAKEFADFARHTAHPNMISLGGNLNLWLPGPKSVEEWEEKCLRVHQEQERRSAGDLIRESVASHADYGTDDGVSDNLTRA